MSRALVCVIVRRHWRRTWSKWASVRLGANLTGC